MDNNNPNLNQPQAVQPAPAASVPAASTSAPGNSVQKEESNKLIFILIAIVVLLIAGGAGAYYLFLRQPATAPQATIPETVIQKNQEQEYTVDALEKDIEAIKAESLEGDFSGVDQDLRNL